MIQNGNYIIDNQGLDEYFSFNYFDKKDEIFHLEYPVIEYVPDYILGLDVLGRCFPSRGLVQIKRTLQGHVKERVKDHELTHFEHPDWTVGYAVRVAVPLSEKRKTLAVHRDALVIRQKDIKIFKVNANSVAEAIVVETGIAQGDYIEVIGDIYPDDRIIVRGNERLSSGQSVLIQEDPVLP